MWTSAPITPWHLLWGLLHDEMPSCPTTPLIKFHYANAFLEDWFPIQHVEFVWLWGQIEKIAIVRFWHANTAFTLTVMSFYCPQEFCRQTVQRKSIAHLHKSSYQRRFVLEAVHEVLTRLGTIDLCSLAHSNGTYQVYGSRVVKSPNLPKVG